MTNGERLDEVFRLAVLAAHAIADLSEALVPAYEDGLLKATEEQAEEIFGTINGLYLWLQLNLIEPNHAKPLPKELTNLLR
jgi:hypothetical protein